MDMGLGGGFGSTRGRLVSVPGLDFGGLRQSMPGSHWQYDS